MSGCGHKCDCPSYGAHLRSISFAPSAMPSRHADASAAKQVSKEWEKDLPAYKRLVESGLQPRSTKGTHRLEQQADTKAEVESGIVLNAKQRREYLAVSGDAA